MSKRLAGIILLAVENRSMLHRSGNSGLPSDSVSSESFHCAVGISHFQDASEGALLSIHSIMICRCDDLVRPPSRSDLCGKGVNLVLIRIESFGNVVCEGSFGL